MVHKTIPVAGKYKGVPTSMQSLKIANWASVMWYLQSEFLSEFWIKVYQCLTVMSLLMPFDQALPGILSKLH